ncbi:hypothetical protein ACOBV9_21155 (plasmid) [Pseudoalteromonas espejiana]
MVQLKTTLAVKYDQNTDYCFSLLVLTGCVSKQPETPNIVSKHNECSRLNTLLDAQASGFKN